MKGIKFDGFNVEMGKPKDWNEETHGECYSLPVLQARQDNGLLTCTSVWSLTDEERAQIAAGANVALICVGGQPPVSLHVVDAPELETPAPIATPEEVAERLWRRIKENLRVIDGKPSILYNVMDDILEALSTPKAEIDRLTRERDEYRMGFEFKTGEADELRRQRDQLADTGPEWKQRAIDERLKVASLTETIRFAADRCADAGLHGTEEVLRAALSPTKPAKEP